MKWRAISLRMKKNQGMGEEFIIIKFIIKKMFKRIVRIHLQNLKENQKISKLRKLSSLIIIRNRQLRWKKKSQRSNYQKVNQVHPFPQKILNHHKQRRLRIKMRKRINFHRNRRRFLKITCLSLTNPNLKRRAKLKVSRNSSREIRRNRLWMNPRSKFSNQQLTWKNLRVSSKKIISPFTKSKKLKRKKPKRLQKGSSGRKRNTSWERLLSTKDWRIQRLRTPNTLRFSQNYQKISRNLRPKLGKN